MTHSGSLVTRVADTCRTYKLLAPGITMIGVSGGVDSLVLLHILVSLRKRLNLSLHVATLDHGLRGEAGRVDAEFVRQTSESWDVPVTVGHADVPSLMKSTRMGIEEAARQARYHFFAEVMKTTGAAQIALAHQRGDQVETILMHLMRGSGSTGLRGMLQDSTRDGLRIVRPMLGITRKEIGAYAQQNGLHPREDATNSDEDYSRNKIRLKTLPLLREYNPGIDDALIRASAIARSDEEALQWALKQALPDWPLRADLRAFNQLPIGLRRIALRTLNNSLNIDGTDHTIEWIETAIRGERYPVSGTQWLVIGDGELMISDEKIDTWRPRYDPAELPFPIIKRGDLIPMSYPGTLSLPNGWQLIIEPCTSAAEPQWDNPLSGVLYIPPNAVIVLRTRTSGERFAPLGLSGHDQKFSDTLINLKVPSRWRDLIPLLTINDAIAWFVVPTPAGLRAQVADPFAWRPGRESLWTVRYERM